MALLAGVVSACASDSADQQRLQDQRVEQAKRDGARQALIEERSRAQEKEQDRLAAEIARLKGKASSGNARGGGGTTSTKPPPPPPPPRGPVSCGDALSVGTTTSCAFARNVRSAYLESGGGNTTVDVYSPTTRQSYTMSCTGGAPTVCTGGNNASVYIR